MTGRAWRRAAVVAAAAAPLLVSGCSSEPPPTASSASPSSASPSSGPPSPAGPLPDATLAAVTAEVRQSRADWGDRVVQVRVHNDGDTPLTVTRVVLTAGTVEGTAASHPDRVREVPAGSHRDASVPLGAARCPAPGPPARQVRVGLVDGAGRTGELTVVAEDPQGHLSRIHGEDCAAAAVSRGLRIHALGPLEVVERDGALVATVTLALAPVPGGPPVTLDRVDGTTLLSPAPGPAWSTPTPPGPVASPTTVTLDARPGRCDPHAVAEDKRGTFLGLHTTVDGVDQPVFYLTLGDDLRGAVYDYVARACNWPDA